MNETLFYVLGICLVVLAGIVTFVGLRSSEAFSSSAVTRAAILGFLVLVGGTTTFSVLNARDEQEHRRAELAAEKAEQGAAAEGAEAGGGEQPVQGKQPAAKGPGGTVQLAADPTQIAYDKAALTSKPGEVTIDFDNPSQISHDVAIVKGSQEIAKSDLIAQSKTSVSADLAAGKYTFFCTVPGHREAGMEGTLTVK